MKDNFSKQSAWYVKYRPLYPRELYNHLYYRTASFDTACDCATGNGQVAIQLAKKFKKVYANDVSFNQLQYAQKADNIDYLNARAEHLPLSSASVDLITVAQAIHWLEPATFFKEMQRIARPNCLLAYWGYSLPQISKSIDHLIRHFHDNVVGTFWDPERKTLLNEFRDIKFPLIEIERKKFSYTVHWSLNHIEGYLNSWSSVQHYIETVGSNPVDSIMKDLKKKYSDNQPVTISVFLTSGYLN